jgi:phosphoenolpyruvate synthase/pyruvate phosphate dikinase
MTAPPRAALLAWFDDPAGADRAHLGGKSASLGELARAGMPVPPWTALTPATRPGCPAGPPRSAS